jgi:hypothetical protein
LLVRRRVQKTSLEGYFSSNKILGESTLKPSSYVKCPENITLAMNV